MGRRHSIWAAALLTVGAGTLADWSLRPELASPRAIADESKPALAEDTDRRKPLPTNFGKLGVSDDQRAKLQEVQDSYETKLDELRQQLKALVAERDQKMESLLTAGQKLRLKELRTAAQQKADAPKAEAASER